MASTPTPETQTPRPIRGPLIPIPSPLCELVALYLADRFPGWSCDAAVAWRHDPGPAGGRLTVKLERGGDSLVIDLRVSLGKLESGGVVLRLDALEA